MTSLTERNKVRQFVGLLVAVKTKLSKRDDVVNVELPFQDGGRQTASLTDLVTFSGEFGLPVPTGSVIELTPATPESRVTSTTQAVSANDCIKTIGTTAKWPGALFESVALAVAHLEAFAAVSTVRKFADNTALAAAMLFGSMFDDGRRSKEDLPASSAGDFNLPVARMSGARSGRGGKLVGTLLAARPMFELRATAIWADILAPTKSAKLLSKRSARPSALRTLMQFHAPIVSHLEVPLAPLPL